MQINVVKEGPSGVLSEEQVALLGAAVFAAWGEAIDVASSIALVQVGPSVYVDTEGWETLTAEEAEAHLLSGEILYGGLRRKRSDHVVLTGEQLTAAQALIASAFGAGGGLVRLQATRNGIFWYWGDSVGTESVDTTALISRSQSGVDVIPVGAE